MNADDLPMDAKTEPPELSEILVEGFSAVLASLSGIHETLEELARIAKTPAPTAACEHFERACQNYRRGLYPESLQRLKVAINGDHVSAGFREDWRFHALTGLVHLDCPDCSLIDLAQAKHSFLQAARYAVSEYPQEAAAALLGASFAAYRQREMGEALQHTQQVWRLVPSFAYAFFHGSRIRYILAV